MGNELLISEKDQLQIFQNVSDSVSTGNQIQGTTYESLNAFIDS